MGGSDDDDDAAELARMRAERAARHGGASTLSQLREQQERAAAAARAQSEYFARTTVQRDEDEEGGGAAAEPAPAEDEAEQLRMMLPMSFGQAAPKPKPKVEEIADKFKRRDAPKASVGPPRPPGFGQKPKPGLGTFNIVAPTAAPEGAEPQPQQGEQQQQQEGDDLVGPPRPPSAGAGDEDGDGGDGNDSHHDDDEHHDDEDDDVEDPYHLPITHEVSLQGHRKGVTCLSLEHSGSRLASGSMDYTVRLYDFAGMKSDLKSFRELEPHEGHPVNSVSWSPSGDALLVTTGHAQAKIYDRDGRARGEFIRGDMYIRDMKNTKGHVSGLTSGQWHPTDKTTCLTASEDGTMRIWDTVTLAQKTVIKPTLAKPGRTHVTACTYNADGSLIAGALMDGTIQLWTVAAKFGSSAAIGVVLPPRQQMIEQNTWTVATGSRTIAKGAHTPATEITSLAFAGDGNTLVSRGVDSTLKIWDVRKIGQPVHVFDDLPCSSATTSAIFSPDGSVIVTGTGLPNGREGGGAVVFIDRGKREIIRKVGMNGDAIALAWHPRLNQIFVGIGSRKSGSTQVLFDATFSERGVIGAVGRQLRKPNPLDYQPPLLIRDATSRDGQRKRPRDKQKEEALRTKKPDPGATAGAGKRGRIGTGTATLLTQHLMKQKGKLNAVEHEMDPREAILRHTDKAAEFSSFTAAYAKTQPKPIFAQDDDEEEEEG